ncbi:hypothetical protein ACFLV7_15470 [Chloroflexota bacterium]
MNTVVITKAKCPSCGERIPIGGHLILHQLVTCCNCEEDLEIVKLDPVILDLPYYGDDEGFFWEDDYLKVTSL